MNHRVRFNKKSITVDGRRIEGSWSIEQGYKFTSTVPLPRWLAEGPDLYVYNVNEKSYSVIFKTTSKAYKQINSILNKKEER